MEADVLYIDRAEKGEIVFSYWSLLMYNRSLLMYSRSLLICNRSLLLYTQSRFVTFYFCQLHRAEKGEMVFNAGSLRSQLTGAPQVR